MDEEETPHNDSYYNLITINLLEFHSFFQYEQQMNQYETNMSFW